MSDTLFDVIQIGYGPVSKALALALARLGRSVAIFERWPEIYPLPRAVCVDHEVYRILHALGLGQDLQRLTRPAPLYQWFNADWKELLRIDWTAESISGGPEVNFVHQPSLEAALDAHVRTKETVEVNFGWEATSIDEQSDHVRVTVRNTQTGETRTVHARYVVGVDGANSLVRQTAGIQRDDRGFEADWLVVDMELNEGVTLEDLGIPACGQYCNPERPTTIVPGGTHNGRVCRRWEIMRLPHETLQDLNQTDTVWALMSRWVTPEQATLVRHAVYTFRSLIATQWRRGRLLIAGDAAHVMPPFMGQGMCAGMRDAWKLDLVLGGQANATVLDAYTAERRPHVTDVTDLAIFLGKIICIPDPIAAAERDRSFLEGTAPPPAPFPSLTGGLLQRDSNGDLLGLAGKLSPHGQVSWQGRTGRWDEVVGLGFTVVARDVDPYAVLTSAQIAELTKLGTRIVQVGSGPRPESDMAIDVSGKYLSLLNENGLEAIITRPDFYIFGGATKGTLRALVDALLSGLQDGRCMPQEPANAA